MPSTVGETTAAHVGTLRPTVAIVGAGASGTLTAAQLAAAARAAGKRVDIVLIDPDAPGHGVAYSTRDPQHRLNVAAAGMSAWPHDPDHFLRWMRRRVAADFPAEAYAARLQYAQYLAEVLTDAIDSAPGVSLEHLTVRATAVRPQGRRYRISLTDGTSRAVDAVVLALGHGEPSLSWAPPALRRSPRFVADPWRRAALPAVHAGDEVVLVGAGLTAIDIAASVARDGARVHLVSRHGMSPLPHARVAAPVSPAPTLTCEGTEKRDLASVRRIVFDAIRGAGGDWRRAVDGLRPVTSALWQSMDEDAREAFLTTAARRWDRVRHRVDPAVYDWLEQGRADGAVVEHRGSVEAAETDASGALHVRLSDGTVIRAAAVVNCTGAGVTASYSADPLVMQLLDTGLVEPGPLDLGFATDDRGRLANPAGAAHKMWTLGPLRKGQLWESTAIPEIRVQAAEIAREVAAALPSPDLTRRPRDPFGLAISVDPAGAASYNEALGRMLRVQSGAEELVARAVELDPEFGLGHAVLALLGLEWGAPVDVAHQIAAAQAPGARADERERHFIDMVARRVTASDRDSAAELLAYIDAYPEDAVAVSVALPTIAFAGATELPAEAWALVDRLEPAYGEHWWYLGLAAFFRQEREQYDEAEELAARALRMEPAAGHAVHAKAHVHYETGEHRVGLNWLDQWINSCGARASHRAHFSWHAALHELSLGEYQAMAARYARQLAPPLVTGVRALVDSASLLWRAKATGLPPSAEGVRRVLDTVPPDLLYEPPTPFIALHAAVGLAAADDCAGLARLRRFAEAAHEPLLAGTIAPLAEALSCAVHHDFGPATDRLLGLRDVAMLGGSAAQREVVEETLLYCAIHAKRLDEAHAILTERIERRPSPHDRARRTAVEFDQAGLAVAKPLAADLRGL